MTPERITSERQARNEWSTQQRIENETFVRFWFRHCVRTGITGLGGLTVASGFVGDRRFERAFDTARRKAGRNQSNRCKKR